MKLENIETSALVKELEKREGIIVENAEPHEHKTITVDGPARILIVVD